MEINETLGRDSSTLLHYDFRRHLSTFMKSNTRVCACMKCFRKFKKENAFLMTKPSVNQLTVTCGSCNIFHNVLHCSFYRSHRVISACWSSLAARCFMSESVNCYLMPQTSCCHSSSGGKRSTAARTVAAETQIEKSGLDSAERGTYKRHLHPTQSVSLCDLLPPGGFVPGLEGLRRPAGFACGIL